MEKIECCGVITFLKMPLKDPFKENAADDEDYYRKRSMLQNDHGLQCSEKLLFYGTVEGSLGLETAEDTVRKYQIQTSRKPHCCCPTQADS